MKEQLKRLLCGVLAAVMLAVYPLRVAAMSGALVAYGGATVLAAGLAAAGIYARSNDWGEGMAQAVVDAFNSANGTNINLLSLRSTALQAGVLIVDAAVYGVIRAICDWAVDNWGLSDNSNYTVVLAPGIYNVPVVTSKPSHALLVSAGLTTIVRANSNTGDERIMANSTSPDVQVYYVPFTGDWASILYISTGVKTIYAGNAGPNEWYVNDDIQTSNTYNYNGMTYYYYLRNFGGLGINSPGSVGQINPDIEMCSSLSDAISRYAGGVSDTTLNVDTTDVSALPVTESDYVALQVIDDGAELTTSGAIDGAINDILTGEGTPAVIATPVTLDGVTIQDGIPIENPVVVTPADIPLNPSNYVLPSGITGFFPFCIPFDVWHMVTLLEAEPVAPSMTWEFTLPWDSSRTYSVGWSLEAWDGVAQVCRNLEYLAFLVGLAVATWKFIKW